MNRAQRPPERYLTTVLMTDIVGSTEHAAELGDSGWRDLVQVHHARVRAALKRHGGREIDTAGDGFFATFDAPAAAVDCALEVAERIREIGVHIRAGVHVGEVEQIAGKVGGITVPIAARIMAAAAPGEVLASATVRDLAAGAGLRFEDRGSRALKGIPGEWRIFAATRAGEAPAATGPAITTDAAARRAAAVRRRRSRPIWTRRPRFAAAAAVIAIAAVVAAGLLLWRPWQPPALSAIAEDAVGIIDPARAEIIASIPVGARPGAVALGDRVAWVAVTGTDTVARVDLATRQVTREIDVGRAPAGLVVADGSVWVANGGDRTVSRINEETGRVVDTIEVGNAPAAIAAGGGAIWIAVSGDSAVVRVDPASGAPGDPIAVPAGPAAIAADDAGVWVVSVAASVVTHLDPASGVIQAAPIALPGRPSAITVGSGAVWVASGDGTLTRIDAATRRVTQTIDVGGSPSGIAHRDGQLWVTDRNGYLHRVDPASPGSPPSRVATTSAPEAVASGSGELLVSARAGPASHRGGTLRPLFVGYHAGIDPAVVGPYSAAFLQADGLVGYRRVGGPAGNELLPALATAIPTPGDGGRTWTFQLRPDLVYPDGRPVFASDFRRAVERSFQAGDAFGAPGNFLWPSLTGAAACATDDFTPVERCDLAAGVVTDDENRTVTFHLDEPDGDFLSKLALPPAFPVQDGVPMNELITAAFPGTGPYTIASVTESEVRFVRNPRFRVFDEAVRPDGVADEIVVSVVPEDAPPDDRLALVVEGEADYMPLRGPSRLSPDLLRQVGRQYADRVRYGPTLMTYIYLNPAMPPFDDVNVRRAVSFGLDRGTLAEQAGGAPAFAVTCQALPPGWPGYQPYCPYTVNPDPGGGWHGADPDEARRLVEASGTSGKEVRIGPIRPQHAAIQEELVRILEELGYTAVVEPSPASFEESVEMFEQLQAGELQVAVFDWLQDILAPSTFFASFNCGPRTGYPCDAELNQRMEEALALQATDAAAAAGAWAAIDREVVDLAYWVPVYNGGADMFSERVQNVQFHPAYWVLLDQLWVQ